MEESSNPTSCPALGDYPTGEKRGKEREREREGGPRGSENENNIPAAPDFFTL